MNTQRYFNLFLIPLFIGCVNLKLVNDYANAIDGYKANVFSFKSLCERECEMGGVIKRKTKTPLLKIKNERWGFKL